MENTTKGEFGQIVDCHIKKSREDIAILSAFCLPSAGLSVVAFSAGLSAVIVGGPGFLLLILTTELPEIVHSKTAFIPGEHCVVLGAHNPSIWVFLENCFPFGI